MHAFFRSAGFPILIALSLLLPNPALGAVSREAAAATPATSLAGDNTRPQASPWVDSVMATLDLEGRIAQLLMIRIHTDRDQAYYDQQLRLVQQYNLGGVAFFRGGPARQAALTNRIQEMARTPVLVAMDAEWGLAMRLDSTISFPRQMTLGAVTDDDLIYNMGREIGRQLRRMGVHMNFAPVVDVNNNPDNPVINSRAFGENPRLVAAKGTAYMKGLQEAGILACAKHFPGHGDTNADSHHTLPLINHSFHEIDSIHLLPFRELFRQGLHAVMIAHLQIPALEEEPDLASTLSENTVRGLLKSHMGFGGLVVTDALDMAGVSDFFESGELELRALMAGNDILLLPENVPAAIRTIKGAVERGDIPESLVNDACRKVLHFKQLAGLDLGGAVRMDNLVADLNTPFARQLNRNLVQAAITLVKNEGGLVPLREASSGRVASLAVGASSGNALQTMLGNYRELPRLTLPKAHTEEQAGRILEDLRGYDTVILSVHDNSMFPSRQYGINQATIDLVQRVSEQHKVVLLLFANPYSLDYFRESIPGLEAILVAYQDGQVYEEAAAQVVFGGLPARGRLPVSVPPYFPATMGQLTPEGFRVGFSEPEDVGIDSRYLAPIDSLALLGIQRKAYPGCQVVLVRDGKVIYHKAFGHHTWDSLLPVRTTDLYDLASLTKIAATTASVMHLSERGLIDLDQSLGHYLPWLAGSNKAELRIREVMAHQARLQAWIPFFRETLPGEDTPTIYQELVSDDFPVEVAAHMYIRRDYRDTIFSRILESPLRHSRDYLYSDLGFILLAEVIETVTGLTVDRYADSVFFRPLGLSTMGFLPMQRFGRERITPSERDTVFRRQVLHGHVNDPAAAMLGGVAGHAGLFSNALDMAVLLQVFLQEGTYAGRQYVTPESIREFSSVQFAGNRNRRGLGFDKPSITTGQEGPGSKSASPDSYGHSGFTGTYAWVDPAENLVYVFLSNRTWPDQSNNGLARLNLRTDILEAAYQAIAKSRHERQEHLP